MSTLATSIPNPFYVDPLGHADHFDFYTPVHYFYPKSIDASVFKSALDKLVAVIPWVSWAVAPFPEPGWPRLVPGTHTYLKVNDLTTDETHPSYAEFRAHGFPLRMLNEKVYLPISPNRAHAMGNYAKDNIRPAWYFQLNQLRGGTILSVCAHHAVHDMSGVTKTLTLLSQLCNNIDLTPEQIEMANRPRTKMVDVSDVPLPPNFALPDFPDSKSMFYSDPSNRYHWQLFAVTSEALTALKRKAEESKPADVPFVSTDDSLAAFFWQHLLRARNYPSSDYSQVVSFGRAVNVRSYLGVPDDHPGICTGASSVKSTVGDIVTGSLGEVAARLRQGLDVKTPGNFVDQTKMLLKYLEQENVPRLGKFVDINLDYDCGCSSWRTQKVSNLSFGSGAGPDAVRGGNMGSMQGNCIMLPPDANGLSCLGICLSSVELGNLLDDKEFTDVLKLVG